MRLFAFIVVTLLAMSAAAFPPPGAIGHPGTPTGGSAVPHIQPNVLFVMVDDMGHLGDNYFAELSTPNLDALAAAGVRFKNAFTNSPMCNPSRVAMLMGLSPETSGIDSLLSAEYNFRTASSEMDQRTSMPQHFRNKKYRIVGAGKIFHHLPAASGVTIAESDNLNVSANNFTNWHDYTLPINGGIRGDNGATMLATGAVPTNGLNGLVGSSPGRDFAAVTDWGDFEENGDGGGVLHPDEERAAYGVTQIQSATTSVGGAPSGGYVEPVFVAIGLFKPHTPQVCPPAFLPSTVTDVPVLANDMADVSRPMYNSFNDDVMRQATVDNYPPGVDHHNERLRNYVGCVAFIDSLLGNLVNAANASSEKWLIVVGGDHGYQLGEHQRQEKFMLTARGSQTTLIMAGHRLPAGVVINEPVTLLDVWPTMNVYADIGEPVPPAGKLPYEGRSLAALIEPYVLPVVRSIRLDYSNEEGSPAIYTSYRTSRYNYIINDADATTEFYDLVIDPNEQTNLDFGGASKKPDHITVKARMILDATPNP